MSAQHTPGPWILTTAPTECAGVNVSFRIDSIHRISIASGQSQEHLDVGGIHEEECKANARLIAAAPDLLEALWVCAEHNALHHGENHNTVIQARAAIAKAVQS